MKVVAEKRLFRAWRVFAITLVALVAVVMVLAARADAQGAWKGTVADVKGVKTVNNPATGFAAPATVTLPEVWRLGGDEESEDEFFGVITDIEIDAQGDVYLLDSQLAQCKIYTKDGEFIRAIGREGEGPGEFRYPVSMFFTGDGKVAIVQVAPGKIVLLTKDGKPSGEYPIPKAADGGFQMIQSAQSNGGNVVLYMVRQQFDQAAGKWSQGAFLAAVDAGGKQTAEYAKKDNVITMSAPVMDDKAWDTIERRWEVGPDGRVYACRSYDDYEITVYTKTGAIDKVVKRECKPVARTAKEKEVMTKIMGYWAQRLPGAKVNIAEMAKPIDSIYLRDDGSMWALSASGSRSKQAGTLGTFDVFNPQGQFVKTVTLKGEGDPLEDLYVFEKDRLYVVTSFLSAAMAMQGVEGMSEVTGDAEPMAVICYKLEGEAIAVK